MCSRRSRPRGVSGIAFIAIFLAAASGILAGPGARAESIVFPADAGVVNVTTWGGPGGSDPVLNAVPNDGLDDTAALQAALSAYPSANKIIYLPNGTYNVRRRLNWPAGQPNASDYKRTILQGQSQAGVVIKLQDGCNTDATDNFTSSATANRAVLYTGAGSADRFRNAIRNLTVNTGSGNPKAIGIQFDASNQGCVRSVTIRSGDGQGAIGLDMSYTGSIGPLLVKRLTVVGFDYGIGTKISNASQTLEFVTLSGQRLAGIRNENQALHVKGLTFTGAAPAVQNVNSYAVLTLLDATLSYTGASTAQAAIENNTGGGGDLFLRNVLTPGYARSVNSPSATGPFVAELASKPVKTLFPSQKLSLGLPQNDTPEVPDDPLSAWVNVEAYGAVAGDSGDDTAAIQAAIDAAAGAGKTTLYLPNRGGGSFTVGAGKTLIIRGNIRRILGCESRLGGTGTLRFEDGVHPTVVVERIEFGTSARPKIVHLASRTLVLSSVSNLGSYGNVDGAARGTGDVYWEDINVGVSVITGQRAWIRQLDLVNSNPGDSTVPGYTKLINDGGQVWLFGYKTEVEGCSLLTRNGGVTELLGYNALSNGDPKVDPLLKVTDTAQLTAGAVNLYGSGNTGQLYDVLVEQTIGGETRLVLRTDGGLGDSQNGGRVLPLFAARNGAEADQALLKLSARVRRDPANNDLLFYYGISGAGGLSASDVTVNYNQIVVFGAANATTFYAPNPALPLPRVEAAALDPGATAYGPVLRFPASAAYRNQTVGLLIRGVHSGGVPFDLRLYAKAP